MTEAPVETDHAAQTGGEPESTNEELTPAQLAAIEAAKAAKKARKAQRKAQEQAERARRLAEEYTRLAETDDGPVSVVKTPETVAENEPTVAEKELAGAEAEAVTDESPAEPEASARSRVPLVTAAVALAVCLAFAVAALIVFVTKGSPSNADAAARDNVARLAAQDIKVLNTMDYRSIDEHLKNWADASTGNLHHQVIKATAIEKQRIQQAQKITTADVKYSAITALDLHDGSASVIASVDVTVKSTNGQSTVKRERLLGELTRVGSTWKVSSLSDVAVGNP